MKACTTVGSVCPEFRVPGMIRSGTRRRKRNSAVVVANEPMPRVSKKFVSAPIPISTNVGSRASVAGEGVAGGLRRTAATAAAHPATNIAVSAPSAPCSARIGFIPISARLRLMVCRRLPKMIIQDAAIQHSEFGVLLLEFGVRGEHISLERLGERDAATEVGEEV